MKKIALILALFSGLTVVNQAAAQGDAEAGKAKAMTCAACHGADGNSAIAMYPKIAGQHAKYLQKQLNDFQLGHKSGGKEGRNDPIMGDQVKAFTQQDMQDLAAYFASLNMSAGATPENVVETGTRMYTAGDAERGITACIACHGPRGNGTDLSGFPKISGQHPDYLKAQLQKFRDGSRNNDMNGMMVDIAKKLTDADIEILSKYISGLH